MFLKNRNIISKMKRSKVTDYAALNQVHVGTCLKFEADRYCVVVLSNFWADSFKHVVNIDIENE